MGKKTKLAVIMHTDVVSSTALVRRNEQLAHERIQSAFRRLANAVRSVGGQSLEVRGDALVAQFSRASDAACAARDLQLANAEHNREIAGDIRPQLRIGIALGEVVIADRTVTGTGVVLAQRIEQLASQRMERRACRPPRNARAVRRSAGIDRDLSPWPQAADDDPRPARERWRWGRGGRGSWSA